MFHTYIRAVSGNRVDIDRASFLMDRELFESAIDAMRLERDTCPRPDASYGAQWVWDYYCERHRERYGKPFVPDVNPEWDRPPSPPAKRRARLQG
jgi:hypothetical protein